MNNLAILATFDFPAWLWPCLLSATILGHRVADPTDAPQIWLIGVHRASPYWN